MRWARKLFLNAIIAVSLIAMTLLNLFNLPLFVGAYVITLAAGYVCAKWLGVVLAAITPGLSSFALVVILWIQFRRPPWLLIGAIFLPFALRLVAGAFANIAARADSALQRERSHEWMTKDFGPLPFESSR